MGFWKDFFSNLDEPAITIRTEKRIELPQQDNEVKQLIEENKQLRKQLETKKIKAIDTDYKMIK